MSKKEIKEQNFLISSEIIYILFWILKYEKKEFIEIIEKAFMQGINNNCDYKADDFSELHYSNELENKFIDFFVFLEKKLKNLSVLNSEIKELEFDFNNILNFVNKNLFDKTRILDFMKSLQGESNAEQSKERFFKELLKEWDPKSDKKNLIN